MIYPDSIEDKIGFDTVRRMVAVRCSSSLGEEMVEAMTFSSDYETVARDLGRVDEFRTILNGDDGFRKEAYAT